MMKQFRVLLLAATVGFAPVAWAQAKPVTVSIFAQDIGTLDPHFAVGTQDRAVAAWIYNALVRFKPGTIDPSTLEPDLAESWDESPDGKTWTFHLRHGVQFHGGYGELTADDVVFSFEKAGKAATSAFAADYAQFDSVQAVDPYTVKITLKQPVPSLLGLVANYSGGFIISKKAYQERGDGFKRAPIGTGPFMFKSVAPSQSLELDANDKYFRGKPKLGGISYRFMPSNASRDLAFQSGEIELGNGTQDQKWVARMKAVPHAVVDVMDPAELSQIYLNVTVKPLDDIRVRQAIAYAINRPELLRWRGADVAREPKSVIPSGYLGFTADNGLLPYDPAKAKKLLEEAGYKDGVTVKMVMTQEPNTLALMQVVQAQLKRVGINLDMNVVEHATYHQMIRQDLSPLSFYAAARFPVADVYLTQFFDSRSIVKGPTAVTNFAHCNAADEEIRAARTEVDKAKQAKDWAEAQRKIIAQVCAVPLIETLQVWAHHDDFDFGFPMKGSMSLGPMLTEVSGYK
jgi:peptide/nickel transport system substrate-binding protein